MPRRYAGIPASRGRFLTVSFAERAQAPIARMVQYDVGDTVSKGRPPPVDEGTTMEPCADHPCDNHIVDPMRLSQWHAQIIREIMKRDGISIRRLRNNGVLRERACRDFFRKLEVLDFSISEIGRLYTELGVDPVRVIIAVFVLKDPMAYFSACGETLGRYTEELAAVLPGQLADCPDEFETINRALCRSHAVKISMDIKQHHLSISERRLARFWSVN
jgi:hypothetical protein